MLEEAMIRATAEFGIAAERVTGKTGIWVNVEEAGSSLATRHSPLATSEKLGAIGVHISRWVTSHGFAYNVSADLRFFDLIVPCGIADCKATSLEKLLGRNVKETEVAPRIANHLGKLFGLELKEASRKELLEKLQHAEEAAMVSA
jgi:lipoyl(octanoyl) transferase